MSAVNPAEITTTPIADLSYRGYDGPLRRHIFPWLIIARMMILLSFRRKVLWVLVAFGCLPWLFSGFGAYLVTRMGENVQLPNSPTLGQFFYQAYAGGGAEFWAFLVAVLIGSGSIANDVRANALQIYFSKPIRKFDYLLGKWLGQFAVLFFTVFAPSLLLYLYCVGTFWGKPLLTSEPYLLKSILITSFAVAAMHAGGVIGVSASFKRSTMAGAIYAACYVGLGIAAGIATAFFRGEQNTGLRMTVAYMSPGGALDGLAMNLYHAKPVIMGFIPLPDRFPPPNVLPLTIIIAAVPIVGLALAYVKTRTVEVVKG